MILCEKCRGRIFIDSAYTAYNHVETFCIRCGCRKFYHGEDAMRGEGLRLWLMEKKRAKTYACP